MSKYIWPTDENQPPDYVRKEDLRGLFNEPSKTFQLLNPDIFPPTLDKNVTAENLERISLQYEAYLNPKIQDSEPEHHKKAALGATVQGKTEGDKRVIVRFTGHRVRPLDPDNFAGSVKDLLDGLRHAGIISGDEPWKISLETSQEKVAHYAQEKTVIEIEYP